MKILKILGYKFSTDEISYFFPKNNFFNKLKPQKEILIHPGCSRSQKFRRYPLEHWKSVVETLKRKKISFSILLGPQEVELAKFFLSVVKEPDSVLIIKDFDELFKVLASHEIVLHNDSGIGHLARALDCKKKIISIFGPANPNRTKPYGKNTVVLYPKIKLDCMPCVVPGGKWGCEEQNCLRSISPQEVINEIMIHL